MRLLQMSLAGGVMIVVITVLRALAINKVPKKTFLLLWLRRCCGCWCHFRCRRG